MGSTITDAMVEASGNDIRAVLNALQARGKGVAVAAEKDATLRMDLFSATQKLMSHKRLPWTEAEDLVFVDHHMVPLMVQEAYLSASRSLEEAVAASDRISEGDLIQRRLFSSQDWSLLPSVVAGTVSDATTVASWNIAGGLSGGLNGPRPFLVPAPYDDTPCMAAILSYNPGLEGQFFIECQKLSHRGP